MPHEAEAWVLAAIDAGAADGILPKSVVRKVRTMIADAEGAEAVNSGSDSAPAKRLLREYPEYLKVVDGPAWIAAAGLEAVLSRCPMLAAWWRDLLR